MVELHFREIEKHLIEALGEDQSLLCKGKNEDFEEISLGGIIPQEYFADVLDILSSIGDSLAEDMSLAYTYSNDILYVRIYDGERYVFPLPFMLSDDADMASACMNISAYTRRELLPLIITDVPRDELDLLCDVFLHVDASCYEEDDDCFFVKLNNECDLLDEIPTIERGDIVLDAITSKDANRYAELCSDTALNRYWGYDVDVDNPDGNTDYYLSIAEKEFYDGVAITLAIRYKGKFAGEAVIYDFDYFGSASIAVRILPDFHGKGVGSLATEALIALAKEIGLKALRAEIMSENAASIKMTSKFMNRESTENGKIKFTLKL